VIRTLFAAAAAIVVVVSPMRAQDGVDEKTKEILKKIGALYKDAKSMHADLAIEGTIEIDDQDKREIKVEGKIDVKRPNFISIRSSDKTNKDRGVDVVSDGKNFFIHVRHMKQYTERKAPEKLAEIGRIILPIGQQNTGMLFQNVLAEDPMEQLLEGVTEGKYVGKDKVGDKEAHHLAFKQPNLDWELWVSAGEHPFILKDKSVLTRPNAKVSTVETYSNWKLNPEFEKDPFSFKPPEGAKKVERLGRQQDG
jgi:hypothetical protein